MNSTVVGVREANDEDRERILAIHRDAFGPDEGPVIVDLVEAMCADATAQPILSLVAELDDGLVGHVLFTTVNLDPHVDRSAQILAPLAVVQSERKRGIGTRLVTDGLDRLTQSGTDYVFVLGYPAYYTRFGFVPAGARGYQAPYPIADEHADAWMVRVATPESDRPYQGIVRCSNSLDDPKYWIE